MARKGHTMTCHEVYFLKVGVVPWHWNMATATTASLELSQGRIAMTHLHDSAAELSLLFSSNKKKNMKLTKKVFDKTMNQKL